MKKVIYLIFVGVVLMMFMSCDDDGDNSADLDSIYEPFEYTQDREIENAILIEDIADSVTAPVMISLLNLQDEEQNWVSVEAETYCESYDIAFLKPKYKQFPDEVHENKLYYQGKDEMAGVIDIAPLIKEYSEGLVFWRPDSMPVFLPYDSTRPVFNSAGAEKYYSFTWNSPEPDKDSLTKADYRSKLKEMRPEIMEKYHFGSIAKKLRERHVDYYADAGIGNNELAEVYFTLAYLLEKDKTEMIAYTLIAYPFDFSINGKKQQIDSPGDFIKHADDILSDEFRKAFESASHFRLVGVDKRLMLGDNRLFFGRVDKEVKIVEINN
ncbi:MAG: hypothetical protein ACQES0_07145 [Bacteroidota bacterium]